MLSYLGVDLRYVLGPSFVGQERRRWPDGSADDLWGVRRAPITVQGHGYAWTYREVVDSPLARATTVADIDSYAGWPSADWWDYSQVGDECRRYDGYAVVNVGDRLDRTAQLKPAMYLRGVEQFLMDLALEPEMAEAIIEHIAAYYLDYNRRVFEAAGGDFDIFMMGDDFGTQNGLMVSLDMWRRFFRKGFRQYCDLAHHYGIKVMHHTCGSVRPLIPDLIDCGLDILQSLQPRAHDMDLAELEARVRPRPLLPRLDRHPADHAARTARGCAGRSGPAHGGRQAGRRIHPLDSPQHLARRAGGEHPGSV